MSREFRWVERNYFYQALAEAAEEPGRHPASIALGKIYAVLAEIECACAGFEAGDTSYGDAGIAVVQNIIPLGDAVRELGELADQYSSIAMAGIQAVRK